MRIKKNSVELNRCFKLKLNRLLKFRYPLHSGIYIRHPWNPLILQFICSFCNVFFYMKKQLINNSKFIRRNKVECKSFMQSFQTATFQKDNAKQSYT